MPVPNTYDCDRVKIDAYTRQGARNAYKEMFGREPLTVKAIIINPWNGDQ